MRAAGAEPVRGDLDDVAAMRAGATGSEVMFHAAAALGAGGSWEPFIRGNVVGTNNALAAARGAGVRRFVHVGTEAALMAGEPLVNVDERAPLRPDSPAPYPATKAQAEQAVRQAADGLETVVVRPRFVWGAGDTTLLPNLVSMVKSGRFRWVGGGRHLTAITHVDNVVEGLLLGAERGRLGRRLLRHRRRAGGLPRVRLRAAAHRRASSRPRAACPTPVAVAAARAVETAWKLARRPGEPPLTRSPRGSPPRSARSTSPRRAASSATRRSRTARRVCGSCADEGPRRGARGVRATAGRAGARARRSRAR